MHELIGDITVCILFAWVLGLLAHFSRQPLILAYLIAGFVIGPFGMSWVESKESISVISELGLIFMLFMIGLEIDLKKIVRAGAGDPVRRRRTCIRSLCRGSRSGLRNGAGAGP